MEQNPPRILVTGATGFVGRALVDALAGRAVVLTPQLHGKRVDLVDPAERAAFIAGTDADILIHLAWVTKHGSFWGSEANLAWEQASVDLFRRFQEAGGRRIVGVGSCAEYDWTTGADRFAEDAPLAPHTLYGATKVRACEALRDMANAAGTSWAWGRVFFSFGPGEPAGRLIPLILRSAAEGSDLGIGPADTFRDFCHVAHVGRALAALALSDAQGAVNVGSGHATSFEDLAEIANRIAGRTVIRPGARALGPGEPRLLVADQKRLSDDVGFIFPDRLVEDLTDYAQSFRA